MEAGGACELVVHARTKADAYRPPAYWSRVADICTVVKIPVIANGEIWNVADAQACRSASGCHSLMLGRGMVTDPGLALAICAQDARADQRAAGNPAQAAHITWPALLPLIADFWLLVRTRLDRKKQAGRLKQWLNFLRQTYPEANAAYLELRTVNEAQLIDQWLARQLALAELLTADV
jgi:tRNA-dihydrouridine synthase C